jgi:hypothetical protein
VPQGDARVNEARGQLVALGLCSFFGLAACQNEEGQSKRATPVDVIAREELSKPLDPPEGVWSGPLEHVGFHSHAGCSDPDGSLHEWLVIRVDDRRVPLRIGTREELARARIDRTTHHPRPFPTVAAESSAPFLTPAEASRHGITIGDHVRVEGVSVPLLFSGSVEMAPVYGIFTASLEGMPP